MLIVVILIVTVISLFRLGYPTYLGDEMETVIYSKTISMMNHWMPSTLMQDNNLITYGSLGDSSRSYHPAMQSWLQYYIPRIVFMFIPNATPFATRLPFVLIGIIGLIFTYKTILKITKKNEAVWATLIIGLSGFFLPLIRCLRYYSLTYFFSSYFYYYFIDAIITPEKKFSTSKKIHIFIALCGVYFSHYLNFYILALSSIIYILIFRRNTHKYLLIPFFLSIFVSLVDFTINHLDFILLKFSNLNIDKLHIISIIDFKIFFLLIPLLFVKSINKTIYGSHFQKYYIIAFSVNYFLLLMLKVSDIKYYIWISIPFFLLIVLIWNAHLKRLLFILLISIIFFISYLYPSHALGIFLSQLNNTQDNHKFTNKIVELVTPNSKVMMLGFLGPYFYANTNHKFNYVGQIPARLKGFYSNYDSHLFDDFHSIDYIVGGYEDVFNLKVETNEKYLDSPIFFEYYGKRYQRIYLETWVKKYPFYHLVYRKIKYKITHNNKLKENYNIEASFIYKRI